MHQIGKALIITEKEYGEYETKARMIIEQRNSRESLNMRMRFPYFIPTSEEVREHDDIPITKVLPYYVYLTLQDEEGNYMVEPDDDILNDTREYMRKIYEPRIFTVENTKAENELINRLNKDEIANFSI